MAANCYYEMRVVMSNREREILVLHNLQEIDVMKTPTTESGKTEMAAEDRAFYVEFGTSAVLALAIVLFI